jgi:flagellar biosynthesis protein FlhB
MRDMLVFYLSLVGKADVATDSGPIVAAFFSYFAKLTIPLAAVAVVGAIFSNVLQVGIVFSAKPITPDFSKIVPRFGQYFKRTLFSVEGLFNFAKSLVKIIIIGVMAFLTIQGEFDKLRTLFEGPFWPSVTFIFSLTMRLVIEVAVAMLVLSIPDYIFQRRQYMESLKMSKEEVKEERKMQEGDPLVKSRMR